MILKNNHITVVMPVYNRTEYLQEAIYSVLNQTYEAYELIIVDDGSANPEIKKILIKYAKNPKIRIFFTEHKGPGSAINFGAGKVKGEYFCRLDSDDLLAPNALEILNKYIKKYPGVSYFYSARYIIDEKGDIKIFPDWIPQSMDNDGKVRSIKFDRESLIKEHYCLHLTCWKKKSFFITGGMRENLYWGEDYNLALRMSNTFKFKNIDEGLYFYRQHSQDRLTNLLDTNTKGKIIIRIQEKARRKYLKGDRNYSKKP